MSAHTYKKIQKFLLNYYFYAFNNLLTFVWLYRKVFLTINPTFNNEVNS